MTLYTDDNITTCPFVIMSLSVLYVGAIYNILSNGNHPNDNNTTAPFSSLYVAAVAVDVALP